MFTDLLMAAGRYCLGPVLAMAVAAGWTAAIVEQHRERR